MSNEPELIEVEAFERVDVATGAALLRVAARIPPETDLSSPPILVIDDGEQRHQLDPLPSPPGQPGALRAAYSARVALLDAGAVVFALELSDGQAVELPSPTVRERPHGIAASQQGAGPAVQAPSELGEERRLRVAAERRAESRRHAITELERRLLEEEELRAEAEQRLRTLGPRPRRR